jgi:hypothetical protein
MNQRHIRVYVADFNDEYGLIFVVRPDRFELLIY